MMGPPSHRQQVHFAPGQLGLESFPVTTSFHPKTVIGDSLVFWCQEEPCRKLMHHAGRL